MTYKVSQIKAIASDLDGTALAANHRFAPQTAQALNKLHARGIKVILATGRPYRDLQGLAQALDFLPVLVTSNGGMLNNAEPAENQAYFLKESVVRSVLQIPKPEGLVLNVYTRNHWYVDEPNEEVARFFSDNHFDYSLLDKSLLPYHKVIKLFFLDPDTPYRPDAKSEKLANLQAELIATYGDDIECVFSQVNCLEVNAAGVTKLKTIQQYLDEFGLKAEENLISFGDGMNDLAMISHSLHGFVMQNADPRLKDATAHLDNVEVTSATNVDFAVARVLNDLFDLEVEVDGIKLEPLLPKS